MRILCFLLLIFFSSCLGSDDPYLRPTEVRIINVGNNNLDSIIVRVSGNAYFVDRVTPGDSAIVKVVPLNDSDVFFDHVHTDTTVYAQALIGPRYGGVIRVQMNRTSIVNVDKSGL